jgi:hypothetical protein
MSQKINKRFENLVIGLIMAVLVMLWINLFFLVYL